MPLGRWRRRVDGRVRACAVHAFDAAGAGAGSRQSARKSASACGGEARMTTGPRICPTAKRLGRHCCSMDNGHDGCFPPVAGLDAADSRPAMVVSLLRQLLPNAGGPRVRRGPKPDRQAGLGPGDRSRALHAPGRPMGAQQARRRRVPEPAGVENGYALAKQHPGVVAVVVGHHHFPGIPAFSPVDDPAARDSAFTGQHSHDFIRKVMGDLAHLLGLEDVSFGANLLSRFNSYEGKE